MNTSDRSLLRNAAAFGLLVLQLSLAGVAPYADAHLGSVASHGTTHVESEATDACGLGHDHSFCQLCRTLQLTAAPTMGVDTDPAAALFRSTASDHTSVIPSGEAAFLPVGSRAPPTVLTLPL